jgi:hypothetical protein
MKKLISILLVFTLIIGLNSCGDLKSQEISGTYVDTTTNLTWMKCPIGKKWDGKMCTGKSNDSYTYLTLDEAINNANNYAGYSDWRVPTIDELNSIVSCPEGRSYSDSTYPGICYSYKNRDDNYKTRAPQNLKFKKVFPNQYDHFVLSSTQSKNNFERACGIYVYSGFIDCSGNPMTGAVYLVRTTDQNKIVNVAKVKKLISPSYTTSRMLQNSKNSIKNILSNSDGSKAVICEDDNYGTITITNSTICAFGNGNNKCLQSYKWTIQKAAEYICK